MCDSIMLFKGEEPLRRDETKTDFCENDCEKCEKMNLLEKGRVCPQAACGG